MWWFSGSTFVIFFGVVHIKVLSVKGGENTPSQTQSWENNSTSPCLYTISIQTKEWKLETQFTKHDFMMPWINQVNRISLHCLNVTVVCLEPGFPPSNAPNLRGSKWFGQFQLPHIESTPRDRKAALYLGTICFLNKQLETKNRGKNKKGNIWGN